MHTVIARCFAALLCSLVLWSCETTEQPEAIAPSGDMGVLAQCPETRPEICTQDYRPVCGTVMTNGATEERTFGNACSACSDANVTGYTEGECPGGEQ